MTSKSTESKIRRFFASRLFLLVILAIISMVALSYARAYYQHYKIQKEIESLQEEIQFLQKKKLESIEILNYVTSNTFVEEKARTELNKKKPGENVLFIEQDTTVVENATEETAQEGRQDRSNPVKWLYYFTHSTPSEE